MSVTAWTARGNRATGKTLTRALAADACGPWGPKRAALARALVRAVELLGLDVTLRIPSCGHAGCADLHVDPPAHRAGPRFASDGDAPLGLLLGDATGDIVPDAWAWDVDAEHTAPRPWAAGVLAELRADAELAPHLGAWDRWTLAYAEAALRGELLHPAQRSELGPETAAEAHAWAAVDAAAELADAAARAVDAADARRARLARRAARAAARAASPAAEDARAERAARELERERARAEDRARERAANAAWFRGWPRGA